MEKALTTQRVLAADDPRHGSENAYNHFACRCTPCSQAHSKYMKRYRQRLAARKAAKALPMQVITEVATFINAEPRSKKDHWYWSDKGSSPSIIVWAEDSGMNYKRVFYDVRTVLYLLSRETILRPNAVIGAVCSGTSRCVNPYHAQVLNFHPEAMPELGYPEDIVTRLMSFVETYTLHECWNWRASRMPGYDAPIITWRDDPSNEDETARIFDVRESVFALWCGHALPKGYKIVMKCEKYACLNPRHMSFSTSDNRVIYTIPTREEVVPDPVAEAKKNARTRRRLKAKKIKEFLRQVHDDLNAHVDYAVCLSDKIVYDDEATAKKAVEIWRSLEIPGEAAMRHYQCPQCSYWHLTSMETWKVKPSMIRSVLRGGKQRSRH